MVDGRPATARPAQVRWTGLFAALVAVVWLLSLSPDDVRDPTTPVPAGVGSVWPQAVRGSVSGSLADGDTYTPGFFVDAGTSIGQAVTADGLVVRLVVVRGAEPARELRRLPAESAPQFFGFVSGQGWVAWAESAEDAVGRRTTSMWVIGTDAGGATRRIVADAGDVRQTDSAHELAISDGRLHWTVYGDGADPSTELRSVVLDGGDPRARTVPGTWSPVGWPWLVDSMDAVAGGRVRLLDRVSNQTREFVAGMADFPSCGATWCRSIILDDDAGAGRVDLVRVDGTQRRRIAGPDVGFPLTDVAVLDRFEVLTALDPAASTFQGRPLLIYDVSRGTTVTVASDAVSVLCRGGFLWWSSGFEDRLSWTAMDLRTLT
ncbi:hypothetical protein Ais01nite_64690 [Asanoa ishikariensis]|uniref:WD40-like Beta Propeller Repeat n=1 Tax=Asanoa ishikariensis TaxID=137265 RepID=A0A1H3NSU3_9ACTN|nr:hypothetical protein [Asanoa ishikariensis]GIF68434.1 hypothetical protein Ais01nite_64690 [Asanoa ishikariensis]SDY91239.1 hypothetical protein SAMN05421684_2254 [Asanoa ishikariensis]